MLPALRVVPIGLGPSRLLAARGLASLLKGKYVYSQLSTGIYTKRSFSVLSRTLNQLPVNKPETSSNKVPPPSNHKKVSEHLKTSNIPHIPIISNLPGAATSSKITKSLLLSQTTNRLSRFLIHIKWPLKRNNRPFSMDDFSAFASWVVMGNLLWFILGTTTFVLFGMYLLHLGNNVWSWFDNKEKEKPTESASGGGDIKDNSFVGNLASDILSYGLGLRVEFQKGKVLPELHDGMLRFKNLNVYSKNNNSSFKETSESDSDEQQEEQQPQQSITFKANVEEMNISLSFGKWYDGKGLIDELEVYGMNCKVFKDAGLPDASLEENGQQALMNTTASSTTQWYRHNESLNFQQEMLHEEEQELFLNSKPKLKKSQSLLIDPNYVFSHFKIRDSYIEIYDNPNQSTASTPLKISIFNCDLPELHGNKLLIDFFNANNVTGAINDSMFTIHKHQRYHDDNENKMVRFKLDGIDMGKIAKRNPYSKFNWIVNGRAEIVADILLPQENLQSQFGIGSEYKKVAHMFTEAFNDILNLTQGDGNDKSTPSTTPAVAPAEPSNDNQLLKSALSAIYETFSSERGSESDSDVNNPGYVVVNFKIKLYDLKASLPQQLPLASTTQTPFLSLHNLRLLIAFINSHFDTEGKPPIIIKTQVIERFSNLYHTSHVSQTKLFDLIVSDIYEDLSKMVQIDEKRIIHEKQNMWSHTIASQLLLLGLGVIA